MSVMSSGDKRRAQRFSMELPVAVKFGETPDAETTVKTKDISSGGVYMEFTAPIEVGSSLEFVLTLPAEITKGQPVRLKCKGKVLRVDRVSSDGNMVGAAATIERYEFVR